jgi:hypothetical protein
MIRHAVLVRLALAASLLAVGFAAAGAVDPSLALGVVGLTAGVLFVDDVPLDDRQVVLGAVPLVAVAVLLSSLVEYGDPGRYLVLVGFATAAGVLLARTTRASR